MKETQVPGIALRWLGLLPLLALASTLSAQSNQPARIFFTAGPEAPLSMQVDIETLSREDGFYLCNLVVEAQVIQQSEVSPLNAFLLEATLLVFPQASTTPRVAIGQDKLRDFGLPGLRYSKSTIIDKDCVRKFPHLAKRGELSYESGRTVELLFSKEGVPAKEWGPFVVTGTCTWLTQSIENDELHLRGIVPANFSGCEGRVTANVGTQSATYSFSAFPPAESDQDFGASDFEYDATIDYGDCLCSGG